MLCVLLALPCRFLVMLDQNRLEYMALLQVVQQNHQMALRLARQQMRHELKAMMAATLAVPNRLLGDHELHNYGEPCPICYEERPLIGLACRHGVCGPCTATLIQRAHHHADVDPAATCPLCRAIVFHL